MFVSECQKLQSLEVMGDVKMLGCALASGSGVGSGRPSPTLPELEQQAVEPAAVNHCGKGRSCTTLVGKNGRGSSRKSCSMNYVLCHIIMNW